MFNVKNNKIILKKLFKHIFINSIIGFDFYIFVFIDSVSLLFANLLKAKTMK